MFSDALGTSAPQKRSPILKVYNKIVDLFVLFLRCTSYIDIVILLVLS